MCLWVFAVAVIACMAFTATVATADIAATIWSRDHVVQHNANQQAADWAQTKRTGGGDLAASLENQVKALQVELARSKASRSARGHTAGGHSSTLVKRSARDVWGTLPGKAGGMTEYRGGARERDSEGESNWCRLRPCGDIAGHRSYTKEVERKEAAEEASIQKKVRGFGFGVACLVHCLSVFSPPPTPMLAGVPTPSCRF